MKLRDAGRWLSGGTPPRDLPEYWDGEVPWVSTKDLKTRFLDDTIEHITEDAAIRHSRVAPAGFIVLSVRGMALAKRLPLSMLMRPMVLRTRT